MKKLLLIYFVFIISIGCIEINAQIVYVNIKATGLNNGSSWENAYTTVQAGVNYGGEVWVAMGEYFENLSISGTSVYGGFNGTELLREERDILANETIINGSASNSVVIISSGVLDGFTITNGDAQSGGGIKVSPGNPVIRNNIIIGNNASNGGGINVYGLAVNASIERNIITGNSASSAGDAIYGPNSNAKLINNTIVNNTGIAGDGINVSAGIVFSVPTIRNCIIWGNGDDLVGNVVTTYSDIEDGDFGSGNISSNPLFVDINNGDFHLHENSPCIDAGDPSSPNDPDGTRADIGAYYYDQTSTDIDQEKWRNIPKEFRLAANYPNPFNPATTIAFQLPKMSNVSIRIYNSIGQLVKTLINQRQPADSYTIKWDGKDDLGRDVASGVYYYQLITGNFRMTRKMILMR